MISNCWSYLGTWHFSWFSASSTRCSGCIESPASTCSWHSNV